MLKEKHIAEVSVQNNEEQDEILHQVLFDVNMRLYNSNNEYKNIILNICDYLSKAINYSYVDYPYVSGISGANVGIPYNIIVYRKDGIRNGEPTIMINPSIVWHSENKKLTSSNCGSLCLKEKIKVSRYKEISVQYYNIQGIKKREDFVLSNGGGTIQHEIEHNLGILIIDKEI